MAISPNVILVDVFDNEVGTAEKQQAHTTPMLHRAFSVFLYHDDKMLIQQRAEGKYHSAGKWANSCCSHPRPGESLTDAVPARMKEEIGFSCDVEELFDFVYFAKLGENLYEYEYDHVFIGEYSGEYTLNDEEAQAAQWISMDELQKQLLDTPEKFSVWFLSAAPRVITEIRRRKWRKLVAANKEQSKID